MATDIEEMLAERIRTGAYPPGSQLPTVRDLAHELAVNKNTIVRARIRRSNARAFWS
jgi:DNA-binding transcriptional regulator YhcF (GntR family)